MAKFSRTTIGVFYSVVAYNKNFEILLSLTGDNWKTMKDMYLDLRNQIPKDKKICAMTIKNLQTNQTITKRIKEFSTGFYKLEDK